LLHAFLVKPVTAAMLQEAVQEARCGRGNVRSKARARPAQIKRLAGMRLLVVEDNLINQQVASELLSAEGAEVQLADNGQRGVDAIAQSPVPFDAVLMDLQMPVMDGFEATHCIRKVLGLELLPVIAMTANAMASDREACLAAGMNEHVGKPFDLPHLVQVLLQQTGRAAPVPLARAAVSAGTLDGQVPGAAFDFDAALARMGGDQRLFAKVLQSFRAEAASAPDRLQALLDAADAGGARALLHTVKGLSATVGALQLSAAARDAETAINNNAAGAEPLSTLCSRLQAAARHTVLQIDQLLATQRGHSNPAPAALPPVPSDLAQVSAQLQRLQGLLASGDMHALEAFELLRRSAGADMQSHLEPLELAIAELDFERAASACEAMIRPLLHTGCGS
jgi:CheY-like chemotaxis protein